MDELCGFEDVVQTYKRQHHKIQNLQKTNIFLKTKIKELDENKVYSQNFSHDKGQESLV